MRGIVKSFNKRKGYGFISIDGKEDAIVHYSQIDMFRDGFKCLEKGEEVEFDLIATQKGYRAENISSLKYFKK